MECFTYLFFSYSIGLLWFKALKGDRPSETFWIYLVSPISVYFLAIWGILQFNKWLDKKWEKENPEKVFSSDTYDSYD